MDRFGSRLMILGIIIPIHGLWLRNMNTEFPFLQSADHKVLGHEYCSGYSDEFGAWNTGFYCPESESKGAVFCCGTETYKYCCTVLIPELVLSIPNTEATKIALDPFILQAPLLSGIVCGIFLAVVLFLIGVCYYCSCCLFYRKASTSPPPGLYRLQANSSSTATGTCSSVNIVSPATSSSVNSSSLSSTPLLDLQSLIAYRYFLYSNQDQTATIYPSNNLSFQQSQNNRSNNNHINYWHISPPAPANPPAYDYNRLVTRNIIGASAIAGSVPQNVFPRRSHTSEIGEDDELSCVNQIRALMTAQNIVIAARCGQNSNNFVPTVESLNNGSCSAIARNGPRSSRPI